MKRWIFLFILTFSFSSYAELLIEPVVGYSFGKVEEGDGAFGEDNNMSGLSFGGRFGFQKMGAQIGIDYLSSTYDVDDYDSDLSTSEWAGFIGYEFPIFLRVYAGYIFSATGDLEVLGFDYEFSKGSGTKLGVGFTGLPFIDINLEMRNVTFGEYDVIGVTTKEDSSFQAYMLSLSLPFTL